MASPVSGKDEPNLALHLLATRAGNMALSCPLRITRCVQQEISVLLPYNTSFIDQACSVKMVGYWLRLFLRVFGPLGQLIFSHLDRTNLVNNL